MQYATRVAQGGAAPSAAPRTCSSRPPLRAAWNYRTSAALTDAFVVGDAKAALLDAVLSTNRGSRASRTVRGEIEELQVAVEQFQAGQPLDYDQLGGLWQLQYTTASDVIPILDAERPFRASPLAGLLPPPLQVGNIYQRFTSPKDGAGLVSNVIQLGVPLLTEEREGVTITVEARYEVRSGHTICLAFEAAKVGDVRINEGVEALLAPAVLPRNSLQHAALLAIKQFEVKVPFRSAAQVAASLRQQELPRTPVSAGGSYQLTYLDDTLLIGRASALGGTFVFTRAD